jgi:CheY-like chemotaxis protein
MFHNQQLRILVVDDNRDAANSLAILLRIWGHDARVAYDGPEAVKVAQEFRPEVITLDIQMPGMHGGEVARTLRAIPEFQSVKIYATSAAESHDNRFVAWQHFFDRHLGKPYNLEQLEELLANHLRSDSERRE